jgi:aerobic-type carbon monoxide dehydrogenase small subunit (CoxS/CutS family)
LDESLVGRSSSCLTLAVSADGAEVMTVEGLSTVEGRHPLQAAFGRRGAVLDGTLSPESAG